MSFNLYNRKYELAIGPSGGNGKKITDLQIKFQIKKTGDSAPNEGEIEIYNLKRDNRLYVAQEELAITLKAGYENHFGQIFAGYTFLSRSSKGTSRNDSDLSRRQFESRRKEDADWISKITALDGVKQLKTRVVISLAGDKLTEKSILNKVIDKVGESAELDKGKIKLLSDRPINHGKVISTTFKTFMDRYTKSRGLEYKFNGHLLNIYPIGESASDEIIKLDTSSGLIGSPELTEKGYKFTSLLRHDLDIGTLVYVESSLIKEKFIIANVTYTGDYNGTDWYAACEGIPA